MREMEFKMERQGLLEIGQQITVTEGVLPSNYYYTIDPSLAMSGNFPFPESPHASIPLAGSIICHPYFSRIFILF